MRQSVIRIGVSLVLCATVLAAPGPAAGQASPSAGPDLELEAALASVELMNEVPAGIRETCSPSTMELVGVIASTSCQHGQGVAIYARFDSPASLRSGYDFIAALTDVAPDTGTDCGAGPFEGEYIAADGSPAGRLLCVLAPEGPTAVWTDTGHDVLAIVQFPGQGDYVVLEEAWMAARLDAASTGGPAPSAAPSVSPEPQAASRSAGSLTLPGAPLRQWASHATASSQYGNESWSATQAAGEPDTPQYGDYATAWAPAASDGGPAWLELTYATAVVPAEVAIWETSGNGFVTRVEAWDSAAEGWVTLWEGQDQSPEFVVGFGPELASVGFATDRLRISIDTDVPSWNEIDAVMLGGVVPEP